MHTDEKLESLRFEGGISIGRVFPGLPVAVPRFGLEQEAVRPSTRERETQMEQTDSSEPLTEARFSADA
jgi:hypothetical protein